MEAVKVQKQSVKQKAKTTAVRALTVLGCAAMGIAQVGFCSTTPGSIVSNLVNQIVSMMGLVGVVVCVIGVAKFALAMKDENPDGQTRAVYYAIAGAILIGIGPIINGTGILSTIS